MNIEKQKRDGARTVIWVAAFMLLVTVLATCSGCAHVDGYERAYQVLVAIDAAQTYQVSRQPDCFRELNPIIGERVTTARAAPYFVILSGAHLAVSDWLNREVDATGGDGWRRARTTWRVLSLVLEGASIANNVRNNIEPWGARLTHDNVCKTGVVR